MNDIIDELHRAYETWCRWHNPMSRQWLRKTIAAYRNERIRSAFRQWERIMLTTQKDIDEYIDSELIPTLLN